MKKLAILLLAIGCAREMPAPPQKQQLPHSIRVVALGDSLAYGTGDESGKGIAGRLREVLRQDGVASVETVNLAAAGASTRDLQAQLKKENVRQQVANADAIVLSIGANDLFQTPKARDELMREPLRVATDIRNRIEAIVAEIHTINPAARIMILGGYNPVPNNPQASVINFYLRVWDRMLIHRFDDDAYVYVVQINDLVGPEQLSRIDNFHPSGEAYQQISKRIATMLLT